jgi:hypothetical protein
LGLTALDFAIQGQRPDAIQLLQSVSKSSNEANGKQK